jgi:hypothetical protein
LSDLEKYALKFSWSGGKVDRVCPDAEDSEWAANVKRAALSALQNSLQSLDSGVKTIREVRKRTTEHFLNASVFFL